MIEPRYRRPGPVSPLLQVAIDPAAEVPLYRQLYHALRDAILSGRLGPGARVPSSRVWAADLSVSRNTVLQAFDDLRSEGYLTGKRGGGTRVRSTMPDALLLAPPGRGAGTGPGHRRDDDPPTPPSPARTRLSRRGSLLMRSALDLAPSGGSRPVPFELGVSALDAFPIRQWARIAGRRWRRGGINLAEGDSAGEWSLRVAIASYLNTARHARCTADQVLVVNGAQQALHLIAQVMLDPGETVWIENPGYVGARAAFEAAGARLQPVPIDDEGLAVAVGERLAPRARLAYVTPSHQFPMGVLMSAPRRLQLLGWARRVSAWIVEDDYDSEFRYASRPLPCLQGLDAEGPRGDGSRRVLYVGTFSKTLAPGLRLGYLVVPDPLIDAFRAVRSATDGHTPTPDQGTLADFIGEGHYSRHIRMVRALCAERQGALLAAAESRLAGLLTLAPDPAGLHVVGWLPPGVSDRGVAERAAAEGIAISPLSRFTIGVRPKSSLGALLLGYAAHTERQIQGGVEGLRRVLGNERPDQAPTPGGKNRVP